MKLETQDTSFKELIKTELMKQRAEGHQFSSWLLNRAIESQTINYGTLIVDLLSPIVGSDLPEDARPFVTLDVLAVAPFVVAVMHLACFMQGKLDLLPILQAMTELCEEAYKPGYGEQVALAVLNQSTNERMRQAVQTAHFYYGLFLEDHNSQA